MEYERSTLGVDLSVALDADAHGEPVAAGRVALDLDHRVLGERHQQVEHGALFDPVAAAHALGVLEPERAGEAGHERADRVPMTYGSDRPGRNPPTAYLPDAGVYATVDTSGGIQSSTGLLWVAPRPWGPWSRPARFPLPGCTSEDGCYTLNAHPGLSAAGSLRVSYATAHDGPHVHVLDVPVSIAPGAVSVTVRE